MKISTMFAVMCMALFFMCSNCFAITVTDPASYNYYVRQIEQMVKQIEELKKQQDLTKEQTQYMNDHFKRQYEQLTGAYDVAKSLYDDLETIYYTFKQMKNGGNMRQLERFQDILEDKVKDFTNVEGIVDAIWNDARGTDNPWEYVNRKYQVIQDKMKKIIIDSEERLERADKKTKELEKLASEIDKTKNIKESQDLTNKILVKILGAIEEHLHVASRFYEAQTLLNFKGVNDEQFKKREERLKKVNKNAAASHGKMGEKLKKLGLDPDNLPNDAERNIFKY